MIPVVIITHFVTGSSKMSDDVRIYKGITARYCYPRTERMKAHTNFAKLSMQHYCHFQLPIRYFAA